MAEATTYTFFLASALEKVMLSQRPAAMADGARLTAWRGTRASVQLVYSATLTAGYNDLRFDIKVSGAPCDAMLRTVENIPVHLPCFEPADEHYISREPGLFPDLLKPMETAVIRPIARQYKSVWLSWDIPADAEPGTYTVAISLIPRTVDISPNGKTVTYPDAEHHRRTLTFTLNIARAALPAQTLMHTEWFHTDCLCDYYGVEAMSEDYWRITENFIARAAQKGINMLLTPVFTPPLDTAVGGERMTVQLVDITCKDGEFLFDFAKLERWLGLCRKHGITHIEVPHFFTQWGATSTPKIVATIDGRLQRIFGWDIPATSMMYRAFLEALVPQLRQVLADNGYDQQHVYYHISDEPHIDQLPAYKAARRQVLDLLEGCPIIDALSNLEFYKQGVVEHPVPSTDHIQPFIDAKVPDLWVYYCCGQGVKVSNRFFAMPSWRNRIMGVLMYVNNIVGFLQWGYNFYYSRCSGYPIDPFTMPENDYAYPAGDSFLVYPGADGMPLDSIRGEVQYDAFIDMRALQLLESLAGREAAEAAIYDGNIQQPMTFSEYPRCADYLLALRERVADAIDAALA